MRQYWTTGWLKRLALAVAMVPAAGLALLASPAVASADEASGGAAAATRITISAPSRPIASGERVNVNILVAPSTAIAGVQLDLRFDPGLFAVDSVVQGDLFTREGAASFFNTGNIDNEKGVITGAFGAIISPGQTVSGEGTFATVTLTAVADSAACLVVLSSILVGDVEGAPVPSIVTNNGSLGETAPAPTFSWWVLGLIIAAAVALIGATAAGLLYRRHVLLKAPERS